MTWLAKVGSVLARILGIISGVTPLVTPLLGEYGKQVGTTIDQALGVIQVAEGMFAAAEQPKSGAAKLKAAVPFIAKLLMSTETLSHAKIANETAFNNAVEGIASNLADLLNSLDPNSVNTSTLGS